MTEERIIKAEKYIKNTMQLWKDLKLSVTPSAHPVEDRIIFQMRNIIDGLVYKT